MTGSCPVIPLTFSEVAVAPASVVVIASSLSEFSVHTEETYPWRVYRNEFCRAAAALACPRAEHGGSWATLGDGPLAVAG
ncbi:hypothetical protein TNCT6_32230 [Streptomyces sp. 6-11-2]|nr:hypothetical protein TNCT6_32230 [Streptomyces sp. 6-11-2]